VRQSLVRLRFEAPVSLDTLSHFWTELWCIAPQAESFTVLMVSRQSFPDGLAQKASQVGGGAAHRPCHVGRRFGSQLDPLRLTPGKSGRGLPESQVTQAHFAQHRLERTCAASRRRFPWHGEHSLLSMYCKARFFIRGLCVLANECNT
jgi:hypothetical protein